MPGLKQRLVERLRIMGVSRLGLLGALITTGVSANAVLPLVAQEELTTLLASTNRYQLFLNAVVWISLPFLLAAFSLLNHRRNQNVSTIGFGLLAVLNLSLFVTDLQWHPLLLRCLIGVVFGITLPMGQFSLAAAELDEHERVKQFTMMLNLVAAGLTIVPFIGIGILWLSGGRTSLLFLFLAIFSALLALLSQRWIPRTARITAPDLSSLRLPRSNAMTILGDSLVIGVTRSMYAFVLVWLSATIADYSRLQFVSLCFTLPFVFWGFAAIPVITRLKPLVSFVSVLILPLLLIGLGLMAPDHSWLPAALVLIALLSIPEAFTPGQLISQWSTPSGRQFGNVLTMALMTVCLSIGPAIHLAVMQMAQRWPWLGASAAMNQGLWFVLVPVPLSVLTLVGFWQHKLIPPLRRR